MSPQVFTARGVDPVSVAIVPHGLCPPRIGHPSDRLGAGSGVGFLGEPARHNDRRGGGRGVTSGPAGARHVGVVLIRTSTVIVMEG